MSECKGFVPVAAADSRLLILGSMPGTRSLALRQYYGHPQNRFWPLIAQLLDYTDKPTEYEDKIQMLLSHKIALWDVLSYCRREGSLDSDIRSERPNDLAAFLKEHPQINIICCNGAKAAGIFKKYIQNFDLQDISVYYLPSTSPANARWRLPMLVEAWKIVRSVQKTAK